MFAEARRIADIRPTLLVTDDSHEGLPGVDEVPALLRQLILEICGEGTDGSPGAAFRS